jgi:Zn-dependent membrane protease YugP
VSSGVAGKQGTGAFDPAEQTLSFGMPPTARVSVAAAAVIAHEVGHARQHAENDPAMAIRQFVVPVAQIGSSLAPWLILIGVFMNVFNLSVIGLAFFAAAVAFTFVTLPVEFGASKRALAYVAPLGLIGERGDGARAVLSAAGWTYVAAALTAILTFLYYLWLVFGSRR